MVALLVFGVVAEYAFGLLPEHDHSDVHADRALEAARRRVAALVDVPRLDARRLGARLIACRSASFV